MREHKFSQVRCEMIARHFLACNFQKALNLTPEGFFTNHIRARWPRRESGRERQWAAGRSGREIISGLRHPQGTSVRDHLLPEDTVYCALKSS